jgi:hypothetical protein
MTIQTPWRRTLKAGFYRDGFQVFGKPDEVLVFGHSGKRQQNKNEQQKGVTGEHRINHGY